MDYLSLQAETFKLHMRDSLQQGLADSIAFKIANHERIYMCGDQANTVYFVESGLIKLSMLSPEGKECLLTVHTSGDIFGELCLSGVRERLETATAMGEVMVRKIPCEKFIVHLGTKSLFADFVLYLIVRIAEQEKIIASLMTIDSKRRLGEILMQLASKLGKPTTNGIRIEHRITHEELSKMVGTTRPRITEFLQVFRKLGLVDISSKHFLIVKQDRLTAYLRTY